MTVKFTNNASSSLASGINSTATSLTVADASTFPSLSGADDYCYLTIQQATATTREVVKATARSGNSFTIQRGVDNTTAASFSSGDTVELRLTSALLQDVIDQATVEGIKTNFQYVPTSGQTQFSGADNSGDVMIINDSELVNVYMNGVRLVQGSDYTVSSANNRITLTSGATTADIIDIEVFGNFTGQSGAAVAITGGAIAGTAITTGSINNTPIGATQANTVAATTLTANSVAVDNITIDGNEIDVPSGNLTLDVVGGITLDADGGQVDFKDNGTLKALIDFTGNNVEIQSRVTDADLIFRGQDGSSFITALTLDMSEAGAATFNAGATFNGSVRTVDGSVSTPAVGFANDTDTGIFRVTTNALGITAAGSRKFYVNATNAYFQNLSRVQIDTGTFLVQNAGANVGAFHSTNPPPTGEIVHIRDDEATTSQGSYGAIKWSSSPGQDVYIGKRTTGTKGFMGLRNSSQQEIVTVDMLDRLVGINESDPTQYHANADDLVITGTRPGITLMCSATDRGTIHFADGTTGGAESAGFIVYRHTENPNDMLFGTEDAVRMRIQSSGVTVGNFTANALLHIGTSATGVTVGNSSTPALQIGGSNNYRFGVYTDSETGYIENKNGDNGLIFRVKTVGEAMRIDGGTGNVGIGASSITSGFKLEVTGDARFGDAVGDDAVEIGWSAGGSVGFIQAYDRGASAFRDLSINNAVTVTDDGKVGIGQSNPLAHVHIKTGTNTPLLVESTNSTGGFVEYRLGASGAVLGYLGSASELIAGGSSSDLGIRSQGGIDLATNGSNSRMHISSSGISMELASGAGNADVRYNTGTEAVTYDTSSERFKENIRDNTTYGLAAVNALQSRMFEYKDGGRTDVGLIAEEVVEVVPELVGLDNEGNPLTVDYKRFVSVLVKAVQEQQALIETLQAEVEALKNEY